MTAKPARQVRGANAGCDAHHQLSVQMGTQPVRHVAQMLRLHRKQHDILHDTGFIEPCLRLHTKRLSQTMARILGHLDDANVSGREPLLEQAADQCGGHVAAANEKNAHVEKLEAVSIVVTSAPAIHCHRRTAAVGRLRPPSSI